MRAGEPKRSPFWLELALVGSSSRRSPRASPSQSPPHRHTSPCYHQSPSGRLKATWKTRSFGTSQQPPCPGRLPPGSPLAPAGGRQRGIFRVVLSLRIRALSIRSRRSHSNERRKKEGAPREARRCHRGGATTAPAPGAQGPSPSPDPARQAQPTLCASTSRHQALAMPQGYCPLCCGPAVWGAPAADLALGQLWSWGNAEPSHPPTPQAPSKPKPD